MLFCRFTFFLTDFFIKLGIFCTILKSILLQVLKSIFAFRWISLIEFCCRFWNRFCCRFQPLDRIFAYFWLTCVSSVTFRFMKTSPWFGFYLICVIFNGFQDWVCLFSVRYIEGGKLISTLFAVKYIKYFSLLVSYHMLGLLMLLCSASAKVI